MSPRTVVMVGGHAGQRPPELGESDAWRWIGWFGLVLTVAGLTDFFLTWIPLQLGSPEWEFGTIAASFSGLPLVTIGFGALLGSALARGSGWQMTCLAVVLLFMTLFLIGALVIFLLVVPVALGAVQGVARIGILKAIARTSVLGLVFTLGYGFAAVATLRHARGK
jgi:hypothetical protein